MKEEVQARRYIVSGRVQGVGFRNYVEHVAGKLAVDGFVRNRRDGSVEVFAMGSAERLKKLRVALDKGPIMSNVADVREEPEAADMRYQGNFVIETTFE